MAAQVLSVNNVYPCECLAISIDLNWCFFLFFFSFSFCLGVIEYPHEIEWVKFNVKGNGYYIVHYAADNDWIALIELLKTNPNIFDAKDRANLIHNIFILAG